MNADNKLLDELTKIVSSSNNPRPFIEKICRLVGADGGTYWCNDNPAFGKNTFVLRGVYNRPKMKKMIGKANYNISEAGSPTYEAFQTSRVIYGEIGKPPLETNKLVERYSRDLTANGFKWMAIVPVLGEGNFPIMKLTFYAKSRVGFDCDYLLKLGQLVGAIHQAVNVRYKETTLERSKERHEVQRHKNAIDTKLEALEKEHLIAAMNIGSRAAMEEKLHDMYDSLNALQQSTERLTFRGRVRKRLEDLQEIDLYYFLHDISRMTVKDYRTKNKISLGSILGPRNLVIDFNRADLLTMFTNLYDNAAKYSVSGSIIKTSITKTKYGVKVEIRNDIKLSNPDNLKYIWRYEVRGKSAKDGKVEGDGIGLGIVADICSVYNVKYSAKHAENDLNVHTKTFSIVLEFKIDHEN